MKNELNWTRRLFTAAIAGSATTLAQQPAPAAAGAAQVPRPRQTAAAGRAAAVRRDAGLHAEGRRAALHALPACRRFASWPARASRRRTTNRAYMMRIAPDRLLHTFRLNAGLASSAQPLGGWEAPRGELRGHTMGHYLSACALRAASAGDTEMKARGDEIVAELARCQKQLASGGYLSAYPLEFYDRLDKGRSVWAPFYTYHKILAGMLDMYCPCRQQAGARSRQRHGSLGGRVERFQAGSPHAGDPAGGIRRHERGALQSCRRHQRRSLGQSGRPVQQEGVPHPARAAPGRTARAAHEHARSAGDRRRAALRADRRSAVPRRGGVLLVRGGIGADLCHRRKQQ